MGTCLETNFRGLCGGGCYFPNEFSFLRSFAVAFQFYPPTGAGSKPCQTEFNESLFMWRFVIVVFLLVFPVLTFLGLLTGLAALIIAGVKIGGLLLFIDVYTVLLTFPWLRVVAACLPIVLLLLYGFESIPKSLDALDRRGDLLLKGLFGYAVIRLLICYSGSKTSKG